MSLIGAPQHLPVIIQTGSTQDQLLLAVTIHIRRHTVVVAVAISCGGFIVSGVKIPTLHKLFVHNIVGASRHSCVVAPNGNRTGLNAVET